MSIKIAMIRDFIILILVGIFTLCCQLNWFQGMNLHIRGFFQHDRDLAMPFTEAEIFPPALATVYAFVYPIFLMIVLFVVVDKVYSNSFDDNDIEHSNDIELITGVPLLGQSTQQPRDNIHTNPFSSGVAHSEEPMSPSSGIGNTQITSNSGRSPAFPQPQSKTIFHWGQQVTENSTPRSRKLRFALYQIFVFCLLMCITIIITVAVKLMVGSLRPDFIARCKPDYSLLQPGDMNPDTGYILPSAVKKICTETDEHILIDGRVSFPSQHSSTAHLAGVFAALLYYKRCWNRGSRSVGFVVIPFMICATLGGAFVIAASRHFDGRHRFVDIIIGSLLGAVIGYSSVLFNCFTPSWECDGSLAKKQELQPIGV